jgi:uncharacterized protein YndB with AHSA1/START domain
MSIQATGYVRETGDVRELVYERTFTAPIDDVWASITEPERLDRWIGTWSGDAGPGRSVAFTMTAEGVEKPEDVLIVECDPPRRLTVDMPSPNGTWRIDVSLAESDGITTLVFAQLIMPGDNLGDYGPGWEYYLDRLVAARDNTPFREWDEYPPVIQPHYDALNRAE